MDVIFFYVKSKIDVGVAEWKQLDVGLLYIHIYKKHKGIHLKSEKIINIICANGRSNEAFCREVDDGANSNGCSGFHGKFSRASRLLP